MPLFTDEQYHEILQVRTELKAYRDKVQCYPEYPGEETVEVKFRPRPIDNEVDQLKAGFLFLQNKLNEHTAKSKRAKVNKSKYA